MDSVEYGRLMVLEVNEDRAYLRYGDDLFVGKEGDVKFKMAPNNKHFTDKKENRIIGTAHTHRDNSPPSGLGSDDVISENYDVKLISRTGVPGYVLGRTQTFVGLPGGGSSLSPAYRVTSVTIKSSDNLLLDVLKRSK